MNIRLLAALQQIFNEREADRLSVQEIAEGLQELTDPPVPEDFWRWIAVGDWRRIGVWLARALKPFGISPTKVRVGNETRSGYLRNAFTDAWSRYLSPQTPQPPLDGGDVPFVPFDANETEHEKPNESWDCSVVPFVPLPIYKANQQDYDTDVKDREYGNSSVLAEMSSVGTQTEQTEQTEQSQKNLAFSRSVCEAENGTNGTRSQDVSALAPDLVGWFCPRCWYEVDRPADLDLFGNPRCPKCGSPMREVPPDPVGGSPLPDQPSPTDGDRLVDTLEFFEQNFGSLKEVPPFAKEVPQEVIDQWLSDSQNLTFDEWLQRKCRAIAASLLVFLRSFQRKDKVHRQCLQTPCPECQKRILKVKMLEQEGNLLALQKLLSRAKEKMKHDSNRR